MKTILSAMTMGRVILKMSMGLENEVVAIWIRSMGSKVKEERQVKRGSPDFISLSNQEVRPGGATGNTYVSSEVDRRRQG